MSEPVEAELNKAQRIGVPAWRRILSLALLGSAVAMVVVCLTNLIQHDVELKLSFPEAWGGQLTRLDLTVVEEGEMLRHTMIRFSAERPAVSPLRHHFSLSRGMYRLEISLRRKDQGGQVRFVRPLEISGSGQVGIKLP